MSTIGHVSGDLTAIAAAMAGGLTVAIAEPIVIPILRRAAVLDVPGSRSSHTVPTPRGGGIPLVAGLLVAAVLIGSPAALVFGAAVSGFGLIGLTDDVRGLPTGTRFALQAVGAAAVGAAVLRTLTWPTAELAGLTVIAAFWIVGFVNAFNFMDGVNGISGAHALVGGAVYSLLGWWRPDQFQLAAGAAVAASAAAFLPWNAGRAKVFLGDSGSYALGAALAVLAAYALVRGVPAEAVLGPLALYLADTGWTLQRRIRAGERWFEAHRTHTYQRWCDAGWSHQRVTAVTAASSAVLSVLGVVSLTGNLAARTVADLAGLALLTGYLYSPGPLLRWASRMAGPAAAVVTAPEARVGG